MYGKWVRSIWQAIGIDPLQTQCGQQGFPGQALFHINFCVLRMFQGKIGDQEFGFAGFYYRYETLHFPFVNGRRNDGKECPGHHRPVNGIHGTRVLQRENDHPVSLFSPFGQQLPGQGFGVVKKHFGGDLMAGRLLRGIIQKVVNDPVRRLGDPFLKYVYYAFHASFS